jgi:hypothetical protein
MLAPTMHRSFRWIALAGLAAATFAALSSCASPTQITLEISAEPACSALREVGVWTSTDTLPDAGEAPNLATAPCDSPAPGANVGTVVLLPGPKRDAPLIVTVVGAVDGDLRSCETSTKGCIVARRRLRFVSHKPLRLPVVLSPTCKGVECPFDQTCERGVCVSIDPVCLDDGTCAATDGGTTAPDAGCSTAPATLATTPHASFQVTLAAGRPTLLWKDASQTMGFRCFDGDGTPPPQCPPRSFPSQVSASEFPGIELVGFAGAKVGTAAEAWEYATYGASGGLTLPRLDAALARTTAGAKPSLTMGRYRGVSVDPAETRFMHFFGDQTGAFNAATQPTDHMNAAISFAVLQPDPTVMTDAYTDSSGTFTSRVSAGASAPCTLERWQLPAPAPVKSTSVICDAAVVTGDGARVLWVHSFAGRLYAQVYDPNLVALTPGADVASSESLLQATGFAAIPVPGGFRIFWSALGAVQTRTLTMPGGALSPVTVVEPNAGVRWQPLALRDPQRPAAWGFAWHDGAAIRWKRACD